MTPVTILDGATVLKEVENWLEEIRRDRRELLARRIALACQAPPATTTTPGELTYIPVKDGETWEDRLHRERQPLSPVAEDDENDDPAEDDDGV